MGRRAAGRMDLAVALAAWALHGACVPSSNNAQQGDASVRVTPADGTETAFNHAQGRSQVSVTPPEGGVFTAVFVHNDPAMTLSLRVDSNAVKEGDLVRFPLGGGVTNNDLLVQVDYQGRSYRSDQGLARGDLSFEILQVAEEGVDFRGTFNLVLATSDGTTAAVVGFLEAHEGAAESTLLDAGS